MTDGYSEVAFVNDVWERCGLHRSEKPRGFHRKTLRNRFPGA